MEGQSRARTRQTNDGRTRLNLYGRVRGTDPTPERVSNRRAKMRKYVVAALAAAGVAAIATAAFGSTKSPSHATAAASPATASVACGTTRTIGVAAPITGPASFIGQQQLRWVKYYVSKWNANKANKKQKIKIIQGDTQLGVDTAFAVKVAKSF